MLIGVLAVQGDFQKHIEKLNQLGIDAIEVRIKDELDRVDGLILPGGESTTIKKLLDKTGIYGNVREFALNKPVFGTCAGAIMLSSKLRGETHGVIPLSAIDMEVERNAYGRQVDSFIDEVEFCGKRIEAVFIRAPRIVKTGENVEILAKHNGFPVLVRQNKALACTFHPELTDSDLVHKYFVSMIEKDK